MQYTVCLATKQMLHAALQALLLSAMYLGYSHHVRRKRLG
jgi:hypothetical protein